MNSYFTENTLADLIDEIRYVYKSDTRPWIIGYSGGKDSSVLVQLVYRMLMDMPASERKKQVYIVSSDTMVENPIIKTYLHGMIDQISRAATRDKLPIKAKVVQPAPSNTFWANIIGRGFPTPRLNGSFRWCTDRLKIEPSSYYIKELQENHNSEVVVLLGVRKDESIVRRRRIEGREIEGKLLNRHETIKNAWVYPAIVELTTEDVWTLLLNNGGITPWGSDNNRLVELYSDADSGECPFAGITVKSVEFKSGGDSEVKPEQAQSCGKSRFGCWICTVVKEDKSLNGFIRSGHRDLIPLAEYRKWLISIRDIPDNREKKRRDGTVYTTPSGAQGLGPFTWEMRQEILKRLLRLQKEVGYELITEDEIKEIDRIWDEELDLTRRVLVDLYHEVTGERLPWDEFKKPLYDDRFIAELEALCEEESVPFDLVRGVISATTKNKFYSNTKILKGSIGKLLSQQWLHQEILKEIEVED